MKDSHFFVAFPIAKRCRRDAVEAQTLSLERLIHSFDFEIMMRIIIISSQNFVTNKLCFLL